MATEDLIEDRDYWRRLYEESEKKWDNLDKHLTRVRDSWEGSDPADMYVVIKVIDQVRNGIRVLRTGRF